MSYTGLGQFNVDTASYFAKKTVPAPAASSAQGSDGLPANLVATLKLVFAQAAKQDWGSDTASPSKLNGISVLLGAIKPNSSGLISAATVKSLIDVGTLPANLRPFVDRYLSGTSIAQVLADIDAGKYTVQPVQIAPVRLAAVSVLKSQAASTSLVNAQTKQAVADKAASTAAQTQAASDQAKAAQAQAEADQAAAAAQAAADAAANAAIQVAAPGDGTTVGPSDLVAPDLTPPIMQPDGSAASGSNIPWLYIGLGAAGLAVVGWVVMSRGSSTPNRRRSKKNRRARRARKA